MRYDKTWGRTHANFIIVKINSQILAPSFSSEIGAQRFYKEKGNPCHFSPQHKEAYDRLFGKIDPLHLILQIWRAIWCPETRRAVLSPLKGFISCEGWRSTKWALITPISEEGFEAAKAEIMRWKENPPPYNTIGLCMPVKIRGMAVLGLNCAKFVRAGAKAAKINLLRDAPAALLFAVLPYPVLWVGVMKMARLVGIRQMGRTTIVSPQDIAQLQARRPDDMDDASLPMGTPLSLVTALRVA
jgi:hypothetical protein